jgi:hypothetical protein
MAEEKSVFEGWAILELMGHRRLAGYVREQELAGHGFIRLDVPGADGKDAVSTVPGGTWEPIVTQLYSPAAVYCLTPTTEEIARAVAKREQPEPVYRYELPRLPALDRGGDDD